MLSQDNRAQRRETYEELETKRNPYLVDYETQRSGRMYHTQKKVYVRPNETIEKTSKNIRKTEKCNKERRIVPMKSREAAPRQPEKTVPGGNRPVAYRRPEENGRNAGNQEIPVRRRSTAMGNQEMPVRRPSSAMEYQEIPARRSAAARRAALLKRKKRIMMQRLTVSVWLLCILVLAVVLVIRNNRVEAAGNIGQGSAAAAGDAKGAGQNQTAGTMVQGLPAEVFYAHPDWTEDFLTPNEYSRPGDALQIVNSIFVHYTANPGTSAAQNRSYFEQQKDTHEASVSAHFIIGYEGEIIQCVPLDEIAYAVMTRNFDSISIECCYKAQDGSFTQETYDSLISLLAWLKDAYDLDSEDILRHYDCGGKKCPLYYTEHEDAWEQLKKDVDKL